MKRVSFKVAKTIKDVGYPQDIQEVYKEDGEYFVSYIKYSNTFAAPTYLEVWLWLWREKKKCIEVCFSLDEGNWTFMQNPSPCDCGLYNDPEEAVIAAIEYLIDANLIK